LDVRCFTPPSCHARCAQRKTAPPDGYVFGEGAGAVEVLVNGSARPYRHHSRLGGEVTLPPNGFLVESPSFVAFHASNWNGVNYEAPTLFTLRSLDDRPLTKARQVRVFHAFGDSRLRWGDAVEEIRAERVLTRPGK
jgi:hypothetical protein